MTTEFPLREIPSSCLRQSRSPRAFVPSLERLSSEVFGSSLPKSSDDGFFRPVELLISLLNRRSIEHPATMISSSMSSERHCR